MNEQAMMDEVRKATGWTFDQVKRRFLELAREDQARMLEREGQHKPAASVRRSESLSAARPAGPCSGPAAEPVDLVRDPSPGGAPYRRERGYEVPGDRRGGVRLRRANGPEVEMPAHPGPDNAGRPWGRLQRSEGRRACDLRGRVDTR
jgi:hypothetical protein